MICEEWYRNFDGDCIECTNFMDWKSTFRSKDGQGWERAVRESTGRKKAKHTKHSSASKNLGL